MYNMYLVLYKYIHGVLFSEVLRSQCDKVCEIAYKYYGVDYNTAYIKKCLQKASMAQKYYN